MIVWTIATWILTPTLTYLYAYFGFPITVAVISISSVVVVAVAKKYIEFQFFRAVRKPFLSAVAMVGVIASIKWMVPDHAVSLGLSVVCGGLTYLGMLYFGFGVNMIKEVRNLFIRS